VAENLDERGRRAPTPRALASLAPVPDGFRILPDPLHGQPLLRVPAQPAQVRLLLDRSPESAHAGEPSQDYLALRCEPRRISLVVTDGVGSSFLGDVAAQILAAHLCDWLASVTPTSLAAADADGALGSAVAAFLARLSRQVVDQVAGWPLPSHTSAVVRAALDQQRAYGSEAMFAAAAIDVGGGSDALVTVAWLGDTHVRVYLRDGTQSDHSGVTADRWSSRLGVRGAVGCRSWPAGKVARIIAYTDGLVPELDAAVALPDAALGERLGQLARRPGSDDIAFVDVGLTSKAMPPGDATASLWRRLAEPAPGGRHARTTSTGSALRRLLRAVTPTAAEPSAIALDAAAAVPAGSPTTGSGSDCGIGAGVAAALAVPGGVAWTRSGRAVELTWSPVVGAQSYAVQVCGEPSFAQPLLYTVAQPRFLVPPLPGSVYVRLRSVAGDAVGPWGSIHRLPDAGPAAADPAGPDGTP
jgi:hypothetical protein